jgi:hypothetical protein
MYTRVFPINGVTTLFLPIGPNQYLKGGNFIPLATHFKIKFAEII